MNVKENCYFCGSTSIKLVNRKDMQLPGKRKITYSSFAVCMDCMAGHAIPYDPSYPQEDGI